MMNNNFFKKKNNFLMKIKKKIYYFKICLSFLYQLKFFTLFYKFERLIKITQKIVTYYTNIISKNNLFFK